MFFTITGLFAQEQKEQKEQKFSFSGFVRNDFVYDSRKTAEAVEGLLSFYPLPASYDSQDIDINDRSKVNMLGVVSRMRSKFVGGEFLGAII